jgi:uncharacterized protein YbdZ (MbtH family)
LRIREGEGTPEGWRKGGRERGMDGRREKCIDISESKWMMRPAIHGMTEMHTVFSIITLSVL